jgi:phosphoglycolate phosphatase
LVRRWDDRLVQEPVRRAVGFDLDMTLVDTRRGIELALLALARGTGRAVDAAAIVAALGPPIGEALSPWFAPSELSDAVQAFRRHMAEVGVANVDPLPGSAGSVDAARAAGHAVVVVTSKIEALAWATLEHAGLVADRVFGNVWAQDKAAPLRAVNAVCFVGDHPADMVAAKAAGVAAFGVTSGASTYEQLVEAGADHVVGSLTEFPLWLSALAAKR